MDKIQIRIRNGDFQIGDHKYIKEFFTSYNNGMKLRSKFVKEYNLGCCYNKLGLLVSFNPNKIIYGHNLKKISSYNQFLDVITYVEKILSELGFDCIDFYEALVIRIDMDFFIYTKFNYSSYIKLFQRLTVPYQRNMVHREDYIYIGTKNRGIRVYVPLRKYRRKDKWTDQDFVNNGIDPLANIIKIEPFFDKDFINRNLGIVKFGDMFRPDIIDYLETKSKEYIGNILREKDKSMKFDKIIDQQTPSCIGIAEQAKLYNPQNPKSEFWDVMNAFSLQKFCSDKEEFKRCLEILGYGRQRINDLIKKYPKYLELLNRYNIETELGDVYEELKQFIFGDFERENFEKKRSV